MKLCLGCMATTAEGEDCLCKDCRKDCEEKREILYKKALWIKKQLLQTLSIH